jgi:hypothetical protein
MANIGYLNGVSATLATDIGFTAVNFQQRNITKITQTASGRSVRTSNATTLWAGTLQFVPGTQAEYRPIQAFFAKARGPLNDFYVQIPGVSNFIGTDGVSLMRVNASTAAGATSVTVNVYGGGTSIVKAGNVIQFANHDKVYMVVADVTAVSGNNTFTIEPPLVTAIPAISGGIAVTYKNVYFKVFATNELQEFQYTNNGLVAMRVDVQETI